MVFGKSYGILSNKIFGVRVMKYFHWLWAIVLCPTFLTSAAKGEPIPQGSAAALAIGGEIEQTHDSPLTQPPQVPAEADLPPQGVIIDNIEVRYLDEVGNLTEGKAKPYIYRREFELEAGDRYDEQKAREGLVRVQRLRIVEEASVELEPTTANRATFAINVREGRSIAVLFALTLPQPSALYGPIRPATVLPLTFRSGGLNAGLRVAKYNLGGNDQIVSLGVKGGTRSLGFDLDFRDPRIGNSRLGYGFNVFNQRGREPIFDRGDREVNLPGDEQPWVHRIGGGVEFFHPFNEDNSFRGTLGLSYRQVSVRNDVFSSNLFSEDELGNPLTLSDDGRDTLLTLDFAAALDKRNNRRFPTDGFRLLFQTTQAIPIGDAQISFNRLSANYSQYIPLPLFGFAEGEQTLVLNVQGGTVIGDKLPPYEAFSLSGSSSVRGFSPGEVGTGRSFLQGTAEYRFPIANLKVLEYNIPLGGGIFVDYATDLGTGDDVEGEPAEVRDKPGDGLGVGLGLRAKAPIGAVRVEFALNDEGGSTLSLNIGDRF